MSPCRLAVAAVLLLVPGCDRASPAETPAETPAAESDVPDTYVECGCGCCGGVTDEEMAAAPCVSRAEMKSIIERDREAADDPECAVAGCALGTPHRVCD